MASTLVKLNNGQFVPADHPLAQSIGVSTDQTGVPNVSQQDASTAAATVGQPAGTAGGVTAPAGTNTPSSAQQALTQPAAAGATVAPGSPTTAAGAFQQALVNRLTAPAVTAQSAEVAPAIAANKLSEQRGMERGRSLLAEQAAGGGTDASGGFNTGVLGLNQQRAQNEGQFAGNAVMSAAQQQRNDLTSALSLAGGMLSQQDQLAAQAKLAELDAQLRREGLQAQTSLGQQDIGLRQQLGEGSLNLGLLSALMGNQVQNSSLGLQAGLGSAQLNQNAVLQALGYL